VPVGRFVKFIGGCLLLAMLTSCMAAPRIKNIPDRIDGIEGFASLRLIGEAGEGRSRFSFLFFLAGQARIDASDFMGRTLFQILLNEGRGYFILPSRKAFWAGGEAEIIAKLLGIEMTLKEAMGMISGVWWRDIETIRNWSLEKDENGRIVGGNRSDLSFWVEEFFPETESARTIGFKQAESSGRLKILDIGFNPIRREGAFSLEALDGYSLKPWEEIRVLMEHED